MGIEEIRKYFPFKNTVLLEELANDIQEFGRTNNTNRDKDDAFKELLKRLCNLIFELKEDK